MPDGTVNVGCMWCGSHCQCGHGIVPAAPDRPGDRDQQQAAELVRQLWWAGAVGAKVNPSAEDLVAQVLAAARAEEAARWQAKIEAHVRDLRAVGDDRSLFAAATLLAVVDPGL